MAPTYVEGRPSDQAYEVRPAQKSNSKIPGQHRSITALPTRKIGDLLCQQLKGAAVPAQRAWRAKRVRELQGHACMRAQDLRMDSCMDIAIGPPARGLV